jgi:hypothetical protein
MPTNRISALVATMLALTACVALAAPAVAAEEAAALTAKQCIGDDDTAYAEQGKTYTFTMTFHNDCARPIACEVDAYVVGARGPSQGHTTLKFAPKAQAPSKASYTMRVKAIGGTAQYSRECRFL